MRAFYASRISENIARTPEGYLLCLAVPLARTGWQEYLPSEIGKEGTAPIRVYRSPEAVFDPAFIASIEGKSITGGAHPPEFLTSSNDSGYARGHAQNIRRGGVLPDGNESLLGDLLIKDENLIHQVEPQDGLREISLGYQFDLDERPDGSYQQIQMRGNHVAIVPNGRAGSSVRIRDHQPDQLKTERKEPMAKEQAKGNVFGRMLKLFAQDAEPEELEEAAKYAKKADDRAENTAEDAESEEGHEKELKAAKDAAKAQGRDVDFYWDSANQKAVPIRGSKGYSKKKAGDSEEEMKLREGEDAGETSEELHPELKKACDHIAHVRDCMDAMMDHFGLGGEGGEAQDADLIPVETLPEADRPKNPIPGADGNEALKKSLQLSRRHIANGTDAAAKKEWNELWKLANGRSQKGADGYTAILRVPKPESVRNTMRASDGVGEPLTEDDTTAYFDALKKLREEKLSANGKGAN